MTHTSRYLRRRPPLEHLLPLLQERTADSRTRQRVMAYNRLRTVALGPCMRLLFEDRITLHDQVRELLRRERRLDALACEQELAAYRHLLPDGRDLRATLFIELPEAPQRQRELPLLAEAAHELHLDVASGTPAVARVRAEANEDLPDRHRSRPSAVHFLRFALPPGVRQLLLAGAGATLGCSHLHYAWHHVLPPATLKLLRRDLHGDAATPGAPPGLRLPLPHGL